MWCGQRAIATRSRNSSWCFRMRNGYGAFQDFELLHIENLWFLHLAILVHGRRNADAHAAIQVFMGTGGDASESGDSVTHFGAEYYFHGWLFMVAKDQNVSCPKCNSRTLKGNGLLHFGKGYPQIAQIILATAAGAFRRPVQRSDLRMYSSLIS